jgi:hypothetical protein
LTVLAQSFPGVPPIAFQQIDPLNSTGTVAVSDYFLEVQTQPTRIDLAIGRPVPGAPPLVSLPIDFKAAKRLFFNGILVAARARSTTRLAVVLHVAHQAASELAAVGLARSHLPRVHIPDAATEVDYKLNIPILSNEQKGLTLNRLYRWNTFGQTFIQMSQEQGAATQVPLWVYSETIDVNTDLRAKTAPESLEGLLNELTDEAERLLATGFMG